MNQANSMRCINKMLPFELSDFFIIDPFKDKVKTMDGFFVLYVYMIKQCSSSEKINNAVVFANILTLTYVIFIEEHLVSYLTVSDLLQVINFHRKVLRDLPKLVIFICFRSTFYVRWCTF